MFSIVYSFYVASGIAFFLSIQYSIFSFYTHQKKLYIYFAALSFFISIYLLYCGVYYEAKTIGEVVLALKFQAIGALGFLTLIYFFISEYTNARINKLTAIALIAIILTAFIMNLLAPYSLRFTAITSASTFMLPWGEKITMYYGVANPFGHIIRFLYFSILVWGIWRAKVHYSKNRLESILFSIFIIISLISVWVGYLIDIHKINAVYFPGIAFLFLEITMTLSLGLRIFEQKKKLTITTQQLQREIYLKKDIEYELIFNAEHDELTGLINRRVLMDRIDYSIKQANRSSKKVALLFIDIDHFKEINDSLGHYTGDNLLIRISHNMLNEIRMSDTLARLGGDEFCVLISSFETVHEVSFIAMKLLEILQKPLEIDEHTLYVSGSIGISIYPDDGKTPIELLRNADSAMYKAKNGRNHYEFYTEDMTIRAQERISLEKALHEAIKNNEFIVYYQPQFDAKNNNLLGMEALIRWNHPIFGMVPPSTFIPFAEEVGLIISIDRWVMKTAMKQIADWYKNGVNPGVLALNLSIKQLEKEDFISVLQKICEEFHFEPQWLELEVTEGQIMKDPESAIAIIMQLRDMGIQVAIDDFGTGYSSLSYLKRLPIDKLKIDKSFVDGIPYEDEDVSIVKAIIALAKSLKLSLIAEGVETLEQKTFLVDNGCDNIQGYFYARPMSAQKIEEFYLTLS